MIFFFSFLYQIIRINTEEISDVRSVNRRRSPEPQKERPRLNLAPRSKPAVNKTKCPTVSEGREPGKIVFDMHSLMQ